MDILPRVRFQHKKHRASDLELKNLQRVRFLCKNLYRKNQVWLILLRENDKFCLFCASSKSMILKQKFDNVTKSKFKKKIQHVSF